MHHPRLESPSTWAELQKRASALSGLTFLELAQQLEEEPPDHLTHAKGWMGQLIEKALGANAGSRALPDFQEIGVELKTLPVNKALEPIETTYVCTASLVYSEELQWEKSIVKKKLNSVLWVPFLAEPGLLVKERQIGTPFLWEPDPKIEAVLRQDFEELVEWILAGKIEHIHAEIGTYLHLRPKAADGSQRRLAMGEDGLMISTLPRGFYLRTAFTAQLLKREFL